MKVIPTSTFKWLNATQFLGALNDNIFKFLIILFLIGLLGEEKTSLISGIAGFVFVLPFLLFSHAGGILADRHSKQKIIVYTKISEIIIMILGAVSLYLKIPNGMYFVLFLMATQSAIFGPSKYGIIPEIVKTNEISRANSFLVSFTFLSIIIGTAFSPKVYSLFNTNFFAGSSICVIIAVVGLYTSLRIKKTDAKGSTQKFSPLFIRDIFKTINFVRQDKHLLLALSGSAYFMLIGSFVQINIIPYGIESLKLTKEMSTYIFLITALGIGTGSYLAGRVSGRNIEFGIVPIGSVIITFAAIALYFAQGSLYGAYAALLCIGFGAGLFIVPLDAFIQYKSPENRRGEILATSNFLGFTGVLVSSFLILSFSQILHLNPAQSFLIIGLLNLGLMILSIIILPDFLLRFIALLVMKTIYRIDIKGLDHTPLEGPALLVSNHVSWVDALLLTATTQRRIRFIMEREIYSFSLLNPIFKLMGIIPISFKDTPKKIVESLKEARKVMDEGFMLCIFAEGQITRSGNLSEFRKGFEKIIKGSNYPIIPVYIGGAWGSIFSYQNGKPLSSFPKMIPYPITILYGEPLPSSAGALEVRTKIMELSTEYFELQKSKRISLSAAFIKTARENWPLVAVNDTFGKKLTYGKLLCSVLIFSKYIRKEYKNQENIGILLPPGTAGLIVNLAVALSGKVSVNINFTAGKDSIISSLKQCGITKIITSGLFAKKLADFPFNEEPLYIEDILSKITLLDKLSSYFKAKFISVKLLDKNPSKCADKTATIIFSSGSTAEPKGVMLSHHNVSSNVESLRMVLKVNKKDNLFSALPFFHSFGYTGSVWFPLISGFSTTFHVTPLEPAKVVEMIAANHSSILISTPTFLSAYMKKASPEDFKYMRYVIAGAEKVKNTLAEQFQEKFNLQILEGYGATELSPMVSVNLPDVEIHGVYQIGLKKGTVGHPLPGVSVKIVDRETFAPMKTGESGLLLVKGPNVMKGYLNNPQKTKEVIKDGWYNTGDIAFIDNEGFITITDRLSRFSKIGGEMVSHVAVEDAIMTAMGLTNQLIAVTSIPDEKKGEQIVLIYTKDQIDIQKLKETISKSEIPNLWKPKNENIIPADAISILGSGKLDLKALKSMALNKINLE